MTYVVTLIAARSASALQQATIDLIRDIIAGGPPEILSTGEAVDIPCNTKPIEAAIRAALGDAAIDLSILPRENRRKSVLVADMDSTIVTSETLDDMAALAGFGERVAAITSQSMNGEIDFAEALRLRVALLQGQTTDLLERAFHHVRLTEGAKELVTTMRANGAATALVSGGFTWFTDRVATQCGFEHHRANELLQDHNTLTGKVREPILDRNAKLTEMQILCNQQGVSLDQAAAIGDGANDLAMIEAAGLGVAFHGKEILRQRARFRIDHCDLRALLFMQGYQASAFRS